VTKRKVEQLVAEKKFDELQKCMLHRLEFGTAGEFGINLL